MPGLPPVERARMEAHLEGCAACREQSRQRAERNAAFVATVLPLGLERLRGAPASGLWRRWMLALPAAALLLGLWWPLRPTSRPSLGVKGPGTLRVVVRRADAVFESGDGASLLPGDAVRFVLPPTGREYLLIVSVDGAGSANVYFPFQGVESARIDPTQEVEAPTGSIVLDRSPGPERVFALWSATPLGSQQVRPLLESLGRAGPEAIRRTTALALPDTLQASIFFEKGAPP